MPTSNTKSLLFEIFQWIVHFRLYGLRNWAIWRYYRDYFPVGLVKTAELPADKNYIFCVYPHGILSAASFLNFQSNATNFDELFPGIDTHIAVLNANFRVPIARDFFLAAGWYLSYRLPTKFSFSVEPPRLESKIIWWRTRVLGGIAASEASLLNCLQSKPGASCVLMPGGAREALSSYPGKSYVILKNRRGFVRVALKTG